MNFYRSLDCARENESLICFSTIYASHYKYSFMLGKSTYLQVILQKSTQNGRNSPLQTCDENQWTFVLYNMGVSFNSRNNFVNLGFFAKVSVPLQFIIPCWQQIQCSSYCLSVLIYNHRCPTIRGITPQTYNLIMVKCLIRN